VGSEPDVLVICWEAALRPCRLCTKEVYFDLMSRLVTFDGLLLAEHRLYPPMSLTEYSYLIPVVS
jgi:hypothetical protein